MVYVKRLSYRVFSLFFLALSGCQTVEYTGRSQMNLISDSQESELGTEAYQEILEKTPISERSDWQAQLQRVGQRIAAAAARPDYQWEFKVLQGKEVNAILLTRREGGLLGRYYAGRAR
jgi:predicted Zn-dependent protease